MATKRRLKRYIPILSELEYDLQCEWGTDCRVRITDLKEFYRHLDEHLSNFINQYQQAPSKRFSSIRSIVIYVLNSFDLPMAQLRSCRRI